VPSHALPPGSPLARTRRIRRRRRRGGARGLVIFLPVGVATAFVGNGRQEHASVLYYFGCVLLFVVAVIATIGAAYLSARLSARLIRPRPRWQYCLFCLAYCCPVAAFVRVAVEHVRDHTQNETSWAAVAGGMLATYCVIAGLLMLGRAVVIGRARRAFWLFPPQWVDQLWLVPGEPPAARSASVG
jgi:hypothetical protein